jgi:arylsulfatase A-like enzyme
MLALLDLATTRAAFATVGERAVFSGVVAALLVAAGTISCALLALVGSLATQVNRRAFALTVIALPWWGAVGFTLGAARLAGQLGAAGPWLGAVTVGGAAFFAARGALLLLAKIGSRRAAIAISLGCILAAGALFVVDARAWHRRYPGLHGLLFGASFVLLALGFAALWARRPPSLARSIVLLVIALGLAPLSFFLQNRSQNIRFVARQQTTATRQLLSAITTLLPETTAPPPTPRELPPRPAHPPLPIAADAHLLLITVDALRPDHTTPYGSSLTVGGAPLTPALSSLAARGVRFDRVYAQAPHSAYSISSLLTSDYVTGAVQLGIPLPPTLAEILGARGWRTEAWFPLGLFFNGRKELARFAERKFGFAHANTEDLDARSLTDDVIAHLEEIHREGEPRTFLWVHYFDVHEPYVRHPEYDFGPSPVQRYDSEVAFFDRHLSRLLAALEKLDRPTVVALTADHGEEFKEHGGWYHGSTLYEEQVRVPLFVVAPGIPPRVISDPVELVDVGPMLLALVGEPPAPSQKGDDLAASLVGGGEPDRPVFSEVEAKRMVVRGRWKLVHDFRRDTWELYDLDEDPRETVNVFDAHADVAAGLQGDLHAWMERLRSAGQPEPPALGMARLGDERAVPELAKIIRDGKQPVHVRAEAARLAGVLEGYASRDALRGALPPGIPQAPLPPGTACDEACAEAALALGELTDRRCAPTLVLLLDDPRYRRRASVMLGRLRDPRGLDALVETIADPDADLRRRAIHYLGFIGDARAIAPLKARIDDLRARYLIVLALARVGARTGDRTVGSFLLEHLQHEAYEDNRAHFICALGVLGERSAPAIAAARAAAIADPPVKWATETLVRLGAIADPKSGVYGVDFAPDAPGLSQSFVRCRRSDGESTDDYAGATICELDDPKAEIHFTIPKSETNFTFTLALRLHPLASAGTLTLSANGQRLAPIPLEPGWQELRIPTSPSLWRAGENKVTLITDGSGGVEVDHLLLLPSRNALVDQRPVP